MTCFICPVIFFLNFKVQSVYGLCFRLDSGFDCFRLRGIDLRFDFRFDCFRLDCGLDQRINRHHLEEYRGVARW